MTRPPWRRCSALEQVVSAGRKHPPLVVLFTTAEETGLAGAKQVDRSAVTVRCLRIYVRCSPARWAGAIIQASWHDRLDGHRRGKLPMPASSRKMESARSRSVQMRSLRCALSASMRRPRRMWFFVAPGATNVINPEATMSFEARS